MDLLVFILAALLGLLALIVAGMQFVRWRRNRYRFSVRALLVSFLILGCALFASLHWIAPMIAHRWAIQNIYSSGGAVLFRDDFQPGSGNIYSDPSKANPWRGVS